MRRFLQARRPSLPGVPNVNAYRLVVAAEGALPERSGYVYCADDAAARAAAEALLESLPRYRKVIAWHGDRRVFELASETPSEA